MCSPNNLIRRIHHGRNNVITTLDSAKIVVKGTLTAFIREQAQRALKASIEAEVTEFIRKHQTLKMETGQQCAVW